MSWSGELKYYIAVKLSNNSEFPVLIPCSFNVLLNNDYTALYYNILFISPNGIDSITRKSHLGEMIDEICTGPRFKILEPHQSETIRCYIEHELFEKEGNYKIQFTFRADKYNRYYPEIKSEYFNVYYKNSGL